MLAIGLVVAATIAVHEARADLTILTESPFLGITYTRAFGTTAPGRSLSYNLVDIDLAAPGIRFQVSPGAPGRPGFAPVQTTRAYVAEVGAQVGINANFSNPGFPTARVIGLAASGGDLFASTPVGTSLNLSSTNVATIFEGDPAAAGVSPFNTVSGLGRVVTRGVATPFPGDERQPRTAVGLTAANHLLLLTVDGRNPGHSDGHSFTELADLLLSYRAVDAVTLDGGGSTTMVLARPGASVVNVPSGDSLFPVGTERPVAVNLAVFARPVPEPHSLVLLAAGSALVAVGSLRPQYLKRRV